MSPVDIVITVIVCAAFSGVVAWLIYRKVKHKGGCCEDCSSCSGCCSCKKNAEKEATKTTSEK